MPVSEIFPLLIARDSLQIKGLVVLIFKAVDLQIQGKSAKQIRNTFDIEDPNWTHEDLQEAQEENEWLEKL